MFPANVREIYGMSTHSRVKICLCKRSGGGHYGALSRAARMHPAAARVEARDSRAGRRGRAPEKTRPRSRCGQNTLKKYTLAPSLSMVGCLITATIPDHTSCITRPRAAGLSAPAATLLSLQQIIAFRTHHPAAHMPATLQPPEGLPVCTVHGVEAGVDVCVRTPAATSPALPPT